MGVYYFALCESKKEFLDPHGLGVGAKYYEILANDFRGALYALLEGGYHGLDQVLGRWAGERVAIGNDTGFFPDQYELRQNSEWTDISPLVKTWIEQNRDLCLWFPEPEGGRTDA